MTDQALITQFQKGDSKEGAFTQLLKRHQENVFFQIKKMVLEHADADDIAQAVWIKVWNKLDGFKQESAFSTWLFRVAYNETLNFIAQKKRFTAQHTLCALDPNLEQPSNQDAPRATAIQIKLERAIAELPEKQRFVFMLRYYEDLDYEKIASITGTTVGGAKANYHQAVKKLTTLIQEH
ncbi:MAG: sigma-70 family RNA polymerase sigma factor [Chitinophagia bacterium]|jgi:RNA polymerase sigma-70 factor (ECF subfamily)|nr:sigma-70 family RNA polymerase sigma factor [Chitinophagia bacterium]